MIGERGDMNGSGMTSEYGFTDRPGFTEGNSLVSSASQAQQQVLSYDRQMLTILLLHIPVVGLLVPYGYGTTVFALVASLMVGGLAFVGYILFKGTRGCSVLFAACLMLFSAIMIQAQMGRIEMHFHIFSSLALLIIYRDWLPVMTAAVVIAVHHLLLTGLQLYGVQLGDMDIMIFNYGCSWGIAFLHASFVVFEAGILTYFALQMGAQRDQAARVIELVDQFRSEKDLSERVKDGNAAGESFNYLVDQFSGLVGQVRGLSGHLKKSVSELVTVSEYTNRVSLEQDRELSSAATSTQEMTVSIEQVAENAQQASDSANQAVKAAKDGTGSMQDSIEMTEVTNQALEAAITQVNELVSKVGSISDITSSISDISEQTNLLALNAAIESARAGEHGRGFAVVADEVRTLSQRTQEFTLEIKNTADELGRISGAVLRSIEQGHQRSEETLASIQSAGVAIEYIENAIAQVNELNQQIASATEEQSSTSNAINENLHAIMESGQSLVEGAQRSRQMADQLDQQVLDVDQLISGYKIA